MIGLTLRSAQPILDAAMLPGSPPRQRLDNSLQIRNTHHMNPFGILVLIDHGA